MDIETRRLKKRLETASWGAFLLWVGICFVVGLSWGIGLIGVAVIIWLTQATRAALRIGGEGLWLAVGALFGAAGLWGLFNVQVAFVPVALVAVGAALLLAALVGGRKPHQRGT